MQQTGSTYHKYKTKYLELKKKSLREAQFGGSNGSNESNESNESNNLTQERHIYNKGYHIILDYSNIPSEESAEIATTKIVNILENMIKIADLNVLDRSINILGENTGTPPGFAITYTLDQSHVTAHSYTDLGILAADIFTCGDISKGKKAGEYFVKEIKLIYPKIKLRSKHILRRFYYGKPLHVVNTTPNVINTS
jgi:S-adenosylmethionine decarboxylase